MQHLFFVVLYQPFFNLMVFFYNIVPGHDIGLAIILLTVVIKLVLYPLSQQSIKGQKSMTQLQPKIAELKQKYKDDKEKQAKEMMLLYKNEKINPFSSCLPLLIQLPFLIAVFQVFRTGLNSGSLDIIYPFISNPGHLNPISMGMFDLSKPNVVLAVLAGLAQFWQTKMFSTKRPPKGIPGSKDEDMATIMNQQMLYFMPIMTIVIGVGFPSGLVLYWLLFTILTGAQQLLVLKKDKKNLKPEVIEGEKVN